jgi:predicted RNase H-like HicB family nuclease
MSKMAGAMKRFTAIFERGDKRNQWVVHIEQRPKVHTFGCGLSQARARIREALEMWLGDSIRFEIVEELPIARRSPLRNRKP